MLVTPIGSCLLYLLLSAWYFCDLFGTASDFDFANEWIWCTVDCNKVTLFARMTAGDMTLNVSPPSIGGWNEWFLIARLMVSRRIRVMDTALNTNDLMNGSSSFTTRIIVGSNPEGHSTRTRQWDNARSRFRDTRIMPYAYWGRECQNERALTSRENACRSCVLGRTHRESGWRNFEGGRRPTKARSETMWNQVEFWNCATEHERQRWRDEKTTNGKECDQIFRTEARLLSVFWERVICLRNSDEEIAILLGDSSILNEQSTIAVNSSTESGEKQTEFIVNRRQMTETNQQQGSYTARNQELLRLSSPRQTNGGFWGM